MRLIYKKHFRKWLPPSSPFWLIFLSENSSDSSLSCSSVARGHLYPGTFCATWWISCLGQSWKMGSSINAFSKIWASPHRRLPQRSGKMREKWIGAVGQFNLGLSVGAWAAWYGIGVLKNSIDMIKFKGLHLHIHLKKIKKVQKIRHHQTCKLDDY
jgi:hypothetical protein